MTQASRLPAPSAAELEALFDQKYDKVPKLGETPAARMRYQYFSPDDHYEALVDRLVSTDTRWLDVGCGRISFPSNRNLAQSLADRCARLVGVDPDEVTLRENPFVHEKVHAVMDDYRSDEKFDLVTLRMVAEHVEYPLALVESINRCTEAGSLVVIYTVNRRSPIPIITDLAPFAWHQPIKKVLWGSEEKDTFPTQFRMNRRQDLAEQFASTGFDEVLFKYLDDCRTFQSLKPLLHMELMARTLCNKVGVNYPENCLLGVYRKIERNPDRSA